MNEAFPSRRGLIIGAMLVALHGLETEMALEARRAGHADWMQHTGYAHVRQAIEALTKNERFETNSIRIHDLMAYTRQTLRVSYEEWDDVQMIFRQTLEPN